MLLAMNRNLFITSLTGDAIRVYPLDVWEHIEQRLASQATFDDVIQRFREVTTYYGREHSLGRGPVPFADQLIRTAHLRREAIAMSHSNYLEVYDLATLNKRVVKHPLSDDERRALSEVLPGFLPEWDLVGAIDVSQRDQLTVAFRDGSSQLARYVAAHPQAIFRLGSRVFEELIAEVLQSHGYEVELTAQTRDGGADILAIYRDALGVPTRYVVECKRWERSRRVSIGLVRALYGVKAIRGADHAVFVTTGQFSRDVWRFAKRGELRNLTLVDFERLKEWLDHYLITEVTSFLEE